MASISLRSNFPIFLVVIYITLKWKNKKAKQFKYKNKSETEWYEYTIRGSITFL